MAIPYVGEIPFRGIETAGQATPRTPLAFEFHRPGGQFYTDRASPFAAQYLPLGRG
jgi:hypothetical protein